jgi:MoxR-like ATPase
VLADEINRATPKTQSALLEAMEERQVTVLGETYKLPSPFFVLATQNPVELEGTYPLPEAQLDRFLMKLLVSPPTPSELKEVLFRTTGINQSEVRPVFGEEADATIEGMKRLVREVTISDPLCEVLVRLVSSSSFKTANVEKYVRFGPGPRGAQACLLVAKVLALLDGRINIAFEDLKNAILPTLRHRIILNFNADIDNITADDLIEEVKRAK